MQNISETDLAYFAGLFDGEGCISSFSHSGREKKVVRVVVVNTHLPVLQELQSKFGGYVYQKQRACENKKNCYAWRMDKVEGRHDVLKVLLPYLRIKREKAEEAIRYLENAPWRGIKIKRG